MWFLSCGSFDIKSPLPGFILYFTASLVQKLEAVPFSLGVFPWMVALIVTLVAWMGSLGLIAYLLKTKARQSAEWSRKAAELEWRRRVMPIQKADVTWDPDTAHPLLHLSTDRRRVERREAPHLLPQRPGRFDTERCVLGCKGFTGGRHTWAVEVADGGHWWAVGVAARSVRRTGSFTFSPESRIWAVGKLMAQFRVFTAPHPTPLLLDHIPQRIQVFLDYATGQVVFSDADSWATIFIFLLSPCSGESLYPWLWLGEAGTHLRVCT